MKQREHINSKTYSSPPVVTAGGAGGINSILATFINWGKSPVVISATKAIHGVAMSACTLVPQLSLCEVQNQGSPHGGAALMA